MQGKDLSVAPADLVPAQRSLTARPSAQPAPDFLDAEYADVRLTNLRDYLRVVYKRRRLAAICFGVTVGLAVLYTVLVPRKYSASARLQVPRRPPIQLQLKDNVLNLEETDRVVAGASSFLETQVAALQSRDLADRVIRRLHLEKDEAFLETAPLGRALAWVLGMLLPQGGNTVAADSPEQIHQLLSFPEFLRPRNWNPAPAASPSDGNGASAPIDPRLIDRYMRLQRVQDVHGTDVIEVSFTTKSPLLSALLAAAHTQAYLDANQSAQVMTDSAAMDFLGRQLAQSREQVERADAALSQFATEHPNVAVNQEDKVAAKQIGAIADAVTKAEEDRVTAQSRYEYVSKAKDEPLAHFFDDSPALQKLRLALLDLGAQRSSIEGRLGPNHPQMISLRRQTWDLERQLRSEVHLEVAAAHSRYKAARLREQQLRGRFVTLEGKAMELRALGAQYDLLKSETDNAHALHESLLKQKTETAVHSELEAANIRVLERPEIPRQPSQPKVPLNLAVGVVAGLIFAGVATVLRESLDNSMKSREEVEGLLKLPILAIVPNFSRARVAASVRTLSIARVIRRAARNGAAVPAKSNGKSQELVVLHAPWSGLAEVFRGLRTAVLFSTPQGPPKVILVTSAGMGEGKTVTALNLATTLADAGWRVLLIDTDLRHPGCHEALGVLNQCGLAQVLSGRVGLEGLVHQLDAPRLAFIPAGAPPPNPAELLGSARMTEVIARMRGSYDFIILDSPPVLAVTDAVVLAREADSVVLVMKGQDSPRDLVRCARDQLLQAGAHLVGVVVNNVDLDWGSFDFYDHYHKQSRPEPAVEEAVT